MAHRGKHRRPPQWSASRFRSTSTRATAISAVAGAICIATLGPLGPAAAGATAVVDDLIDDGVVYDATDDQNGLDFFDDVPGNAIIVVTPGTDDATLFPRIYPLMGSRTTLVVNYPESFGPIIAGKSGQLPFLAPLYDDSKTVAIDRNLEVMRAFDAAASGGPPLVVYTGYSQGADAVGNAAEIAHQEGYLDPSQTRVVLVSDPRSPWGIKPWLADMPILPQVATVIGIESDGARDPGATGDTPVTSVIIVGDPVANFQWVWCRPVSSLIVDAAGFLTIHTGNGPSTYADIDNYDAPTIYHSVDGDTRYEVYDVGHPLAVATQWVYDELGISYTDDDIENWNRQAEIFYPLQRPEVGNASVPVVEEPPAPPSPSYRVTMSAAAATGAAAPAVDDADNLDPTPTTRTAPKTGSDPTTTTPEPTGGAPAESTPGGPTAPTPTEEVEREPAPNSGTDDSAPTADSQSVDPTSEAGSTTAPSGEATKPAAESESGGQAESGGEAESGGAITSDTSDDAGPSSDEDTGETTSSEGDAGASGQSGS
ncbi:hypothetical protein GIY30_16585 [Gordonia sp. HNM0687]|uniref:PE-PPE domain-containing protein n=1 Tax=Gordonia mangrovi TaxID=2665643 RepID=A0A6L7GSP5_9ACTN|nr:hypothetical protein [Gordonia mangrovi]MXP22956.1 hypothetical protein [Gordonia mangrovi]UVF77254.1 hypothetical protein NWF22_18395 [Gordonia mangrovi]